PSSWHPASCRRPRGEVPVHQVGAHLSLQYFIAPVPDMLEDQQPQYHVSRRAPTATTAALRMSFGQSLVHGRNHGLVRQHRIGMLHPVSAEIAHSLSNKSATEAELRPPHLNHAAFLAPSTCPVPGAADHD